MRIIIKSFDRQYGVQGAYFEPTSMPGCKGRFSVPTSVSIDDFPNRDVGDEMRYVDNTPNKNREFSAPKNFDGSYYTDVKDYIRGNSKFSKTQGWDDRGYGYHWSPSDGAWVADNGDPHPIKFFDDLPYKEGHDYNDVDESLAHKVTESIIRKLRKLS